MPSPNKEAVKFCHKAFASSAKFHNLFLAWLSSEPGLSPEDRDALADSLQTSADVMSRLAQDMRAGDDETISPEKE
jgi:hypothetical protein